jgi:hypothetical protein
MGLWMQPRNEKFFTLFSKAGAFNAPIWTPAGSKAGSRPRRPVLVVRVAGPRSLTTRGTVVRRGSVPAGATAAKKPAGKSVAGVASTSSRKVARSRKATT